MSKSKTIISKCKALKISAPTAQVLVEILSHCRGFSKRIDILERDYYRKVGKAAARNPHSNFGRLCLRLLEFDLLQEKKADGGYRIALNKNVWERDLETLELLAQYAELLHEEMRADSTISTIVSRVRKLFHEDTGDAVSHSVVGPVVAYVVTQKDPEIQDGKFVRFKHTSRRPDQIHKTRPPSSAKQQEREEYEDLFSSLIEPENEPENDVGSLWPSTLLGHLKGNNYQANFHPSQEIIVSISLTQNRSQQVYIRKEADGVIRIETISGPVEEVVTSLIQIFRRNDEISPIKIAVLDRSNIPFVGCISAAFLSVENLPLIEELVLKTARLGDELEHTYWGKDLY
ncbi:MAG: hypothetical protein RLW87_18785 [Alphaproteobacteria bacterium]